MPGTMRHRSGTTLIEGLVILAICGLLATMALTVRSAEIAVHTEAAALARRIVADRTATIARGHGTPCVSPVVDRAAVIAWPTRGLVFSPDGLPRTCDGGGVGNTTILLEHRGRRAAVIVSSLGRVRWEPR